VRTGCGGSSLRSDDFSLSVRAGFVFHGTRAGYRTSGSASSGSLAHGHRAGRIEISGNSSDFTTSGSVLDITADTSGAGVPQTASVKPPGVRRFHGSATLNATRISRDVDAIATSVVQHLAGLLDAKVKIILEIEAELPSGAPENVVRTVTENCRTLKFDSQGFEEA